MHRELLFDSRRTRRRFTLIDVKLRHKAISIFPALLGSALMLPALTAVLRAESAAANAGPPPSGSGFYPVSQVHRGQIATAWTVFMGTKPEPMEVEILGVLRGARGPGHDMILAQLHGS
jgi:hypothetical protein